MPNKKAQVGETMTWIVATLLIIIILILSIFIVSLLAAGNAGLLASSEKEKDFVATRSVINFLNKNSNIQLIEDSVQNSNYDLLKNEMQPFLISLGEINGVKGWNFELKVNGIKEFDIKTSMVGITLSINEYNNLNFKLPLSSNPNKIIELNFLEVCQGPCP